MIEPDGQNLVFILSAPRSGSTLLGSILGNHAETLCVPEPWLLLPLSALHSEDASIVAPWVPSTARDAWGEWARPTWLARAAGAYAREIYNALLLDAGKRYFIDKTPRYYHILPWLDEVFPSARKVWLVRNPLDVAASLKDRWSIPLDELLGRKATPRSFDGTVAFALLARFFDAESPVRHRIRYEDLVADPYEQVSRLCARVGLPFEPAMLTYGANATLVESLRRARMGDKRILAHSVPHSGSVGRWRTAFTHAEIKDLLLTLGRGPFEQQGYGDVLEEGARMAGLTPSEIHPEGRMSSLLERYKEYGRFGRFLADDFRANASAAGARHRVFRLMRRLSRWALLDQALHALGLRR